MRLKYTIWAAAFIVSGYTEAPYQGNMIYSKSSEPMTDPYSSSETSSLKQIRSPGFEELDCLKTRVDLWERVYTELDKGYAFVVRESDMLVLEKIEWPEDKKLKKAIYKRLVKTYGEDTFKIQSGIKTRFEAGYTTYENGLGKIVHEKFKAAGLPRELALLPHVESSYNTTAKSSVKAHGLFQIMPFWAKPLGLKGYKELSDPVKSTNAAIKLLKFSFTKLNGNWPITVTSWNQGLGAMDKAMDKHGADLCAVVDKYDGKRFGYAGRNFFASLLAVIRIVEKRQSKIYESYK